MADCDVQNMGGHGQLVSCGIQNAANGGKTCSMGSILLKVGTFPAAALRTSASKSLSSFKRDGSSSVLLAEAEVMAIN